MIVRIGTAPKYMISVEGKFLLAAQTAWGEINGETAEEFVLGIKSILSQTPVVEVGHSEGPRGTYFGMLSCAYARCLEVAFSWERKWTVDSLSNFRNSDGSVGIVSRDLAYCICPLSLVYNDYFENEDSCASWYFKVKNGDLPPSSPGDLMVLASSMVRKPIESAPKSPIVPEPTPPRALEMIEMIRGKASSPKFRKFPENKQAELLKAAQAALTLLKLPVDPSALNPEAVVQAIDREVQEFRLLGESKIPDVLLATLSALYGYCLVWAYGAEWKLAPKDEGDILYVIGIGEDGWAQPSDLVKTALQGMKRSSLSSSFKSFHRP